MYKPHLLATILCCLAATPCLGQQVADTGQLSAEALAAATDLTLNGTLTTEGNSDFRKLRDLCHNLRHLDLSRARCSHIPRNAFHSRHGLETISLPAQVETIGTQAFYACTALREVTLPAGLRHVEASAFARCEALTDLTIEGTPEVGDFAFMGVSSLRSLTLRSAVPPRLSPTAFSGIDVRKVKLHLPPGATEAYRRAEGWQRFFGEGKAEVAVCNPTACLMPAPATLVMNPEAPALHVASRWIITAPKTLDNEKAIARQMLDRRLTGLKRKGQTRLTLALDTIEGGTEAYSLHIDAEGVTIKGCDAAGVFYGLMTLDQLLRGNGAELPCASLPALHIDDRPRLPMRELMVDPCRHFIPLDELKAFIPEMARYKLNTLHLHLSDDQAWRVEIKAYPELTEKASFRVGMDDSMAPIGGYYTQQQLKDLVEFAKKYHVELIPEIEMPGHEVAAIHVFPQLTCHAKQLPIRTTCGVSNELLCPGSEFTYRFLGQVFRELAAIFPSPYVHLGGDEAGNPALDCWTECPNCQQLKRKLGITTTDRSDNWRLQEYLFGRIIDTLQTQHSKVPMFWYETDFKHIPEGCVTFAWRHGLTKAALLAARANNAKILLCPGEHCYLDYPMAHGDMPEKNWGMPTTTLKQTYSLDPAWGMDEDFQKNNVLGVAGTLWSECIDTPERIYYQAYPRALALSEAGWSPQAVRSWEGFKLRLAPTLRDMQRRGISFSMEGMR